MSVYFDFGVWDGPAYGIAYAVLEQLRALQALAVPVCNIVIGRASVQHRQLLQDYALPMKTLPVPRRFVAPAAPAFAGLERLFLGRNVFYQIGAHALHRLPPEQYVVAMHDMVSVRYPEGEAKIPAYMQELLNAAGKIITVSAFSKNEICTCFAVDPHKVFVVPNGCNQQRFNLQKDDALFRRLVHEYALPEKYLLAYGGNAPRKNFARLCAAYARLKTDTPLIIFGGFHYHGPANIRTLGYVPEAAAAEILKRAQAFVLPSYYEGFGLPVVEAMACGVPVACAKASALPEVSGGQARFFDPFSEAEMAAAMHDIMSDEALRRELASKGPAWAGGFTWEQSARKLYDSITCNQ